VLLKSHVLGPPYEGFRIYGEALLHPTPTFAEAKPRAGLIGDNLAGFKGFRTENESSQGLDWLTFSKFARQRSAKLVKVDGSVLRVYGE
jgi:hypothetical protein